MKLLVVEALLLFSLISCTHPSASRLPASTPQEDTILTELSKSLDSSEFLNSSAKEKMNYIRKTFSSAKHESNSQYYFPVGDFHVTGASQLDDYLNLVVLRPQVEGYEWRGWVDGVSIDLPRNQIRYRIADNFNYEIRADDKIIDGNSLIRKTRASCSPKKFSPAYVTDINHYRSLKIGDTHIDYQFDVRIRDKKFKHFCVIKGLSKAEVQDL